MCPQKPEMSDQLQRFRIEAAWQLGQWADIGNVDFAAHENW
jgi:hypothetical protein